LTSLFANVEAFARARQNARDIAEQHAGLDRFRADMRSQIERLL
jgi:hypothetical protein